MSAKLSQVPEVRAFAAQVAGMAVGQCRFIGNQALLNIALAAVRLDVNRDQVRPLAWAIAETFVARTVTLNDIDMRQWSEVQRYCRLPGSPGFSMRENKPWITAK